MLSSRVHRDVEVDRWASFPRGDRNRIVFCWMEL